jgi:hypothetical protein
VIISRKTKIDTKEHIIDEALAYISETSTPTYRDTKKLNIFQRKVYRRTLGPVYDSKKENWRILTDKEVYATVNRPTITDTIRLHRSCWFGDVQRMEGNRIVLVWGCTESGRK